MSITVRLSTEAAHFIRTMQSAGLLGENAMVRVPHSLESDHGAAVHAKAQAGIDALEPQMEALHAALDELQRKTAPAGVVLTHLRLALVRARLYTALAAQTADHQAGLALIRLANDWAKQSARSSRTAHSLGVPAEDVLREERRASRVAAAFQTVIDEMGLPTRHQTTFVERFLIDADRTLGDEDDDSPPDAGVPAKTP